MSAATGTEWRIAGEEIGSCNCAWGCPCQFNALPTTGNCEALIAFEIREGHYGDTPLDGVRFAEIVHWPGPIHEGNGTRQLIVDERATEEQRAAIVAMTSGAQGGAYFEIFASVLPNEREPLTAPIDFQTDRERREASVRVGDLGETRVEPIKNPVTGDEHRVRIVIPDGFEYAEAEIGNTVECRTTADAPLALTLDNTYAQLNEFDWTNAA
jgi:hypothetical protein